MAAKEWIEIVGQYLRDNIAVMLALALVIIKMVLVRLVADKESQIRSIARFPEELAYITLSFLIAGLNGDLRAFKVYFSDSQHPTSDIVVLVLISLVLCAWVHFIDSRFVVPHLERWRAAELVIDEKISKQEAKKRANLPITGVENYQRVWTYNFGAMAIFFLLECIPAVWALGYVADIIAHNQ